MKKSKNSLLNRILSYLDDATVTNLSQRVMNDEDRIILAVMAFIYIGNPDTTLTLDNLTVDGIYFKK